MGLAQRLVHVAAGHFRIPEVDAREEGEDGARRDHVVEVCDDVVGIVQVQIAEVEAQRQARQTADAEHRQEGQREEHGRVEADRAAPQGHEQAGQNDHRRNRDDHRGGLEERGNLRAHASQIHVVSPDDEADETHGQHRVNEGLVAPQRLAGVAGDDFRNHTHRRQDEHINLRMPKEPEQVLPEQRTAATGDVIGLARDHQTRRQEEAGAKHLVHQLEDACGFQRREREQEDKRRDKLCPCEERHPHPGEARRAQLNDRGNEVHRSQQRRRDQQHHADQPEGLAVGRDDRSQRRIRRPAALSRAARNEKAHKHHHAASRKGLVAGHVDARESHVHRADLQWHHVVAERGKGQWHHRQEHHDRAVHGPEGVVEIRGHHATLGHITEHRLQHPTHDRDGHTRLGDLPAHAHHQQEPEEEERQGRKTVLDADDLVIGRENVGPQEPGVVVMLVAVSLLRVRGCLGLHRLFTGSAARRALCLTRRK